MSWTTYFWAKPGIATSTMPGKYLSGNAVSLKAQNIFQYYHYESVILWDLISKEEFKKCPSSNFW